MGVWGYAATYTSLLRSAVPPKPWPNDLEVPDSGYDDVVVSSTSTMQVFLGLAAVEILKRAPRTWASWATAKANNKLELEVRNRVCALIVSDAGEIQRVVAVVAVRLEDSGGRVFTQLGKWKDGQASASCTLPGTKMMD